jgi:hypothetical protein
MATAALNEEQIRHCVSVVDAWEASGQTCTQFAQHCGMRGVQLRAWSSHAPRWRARLAGQPNPSAADSIKASAGFVRAQVQDARRAASVGGTAASQVRIECHGAGRSAVLHWPTQAHQDCAQWLKAWLS